MAASAAAKPANRFYVYLFLRHDGTPYYVGKGTGRRQWEGSRRINMPKDLNRNLRILDQMTEEDAFAWEKLLIAVYGRKDLGAGILCNLTDGGDGTSGNVFSEESKAKMSAAKIGKPRSEAARQRIREVTTGRLHTPEAKAKISATKTGKKLTPEHIAKLKAVHSGVKQSQETIEKRAKKMREKWKDPEHRAKVRASMIAAWERRRAQKSEAA
jgi:hypothetical protein